LLGIQRNVRGWQRRKRAQVGVESSAVPLGSTGTAVMCDLLELLELPSAAPKTQHQKQHATQEKFGARVVRHRYLAISSRYSLHANTSGTVRRTVSSSMGVSQMWDVAVKEPTTRRRGKVPQVSHQRQTS